MSSFIIEGGHRLSGEIVPQGAKNEALQVICASLLTEQTVRISNIPEIVDVFNLLELLKAIGVEVKKHAKGDYSFTASKIDETYIRSKEFVAQCSKLRGSILLAGPLLARVGRIFFPKPGGDKIGRRKVDTHLEAFVNLGAELNYDPNLKVYELGFKDKIEGRYILLSEASLTGTANVIMVSVCARGTTTIYNAACEPYVQQLCRLLCSMGAKISGIGSNLLTIQGVESLHGAEHRVLPDMIEVGSFIGMAALTQSELTIKDVSWDNLGIIPESFRKIGVKLEKRGEDIFIPSQESYKIESFIDGSIMTINDSTWPGLTPDLLSVILVVATQCKGSVLIHQRMFESRLFFVDRLIEMGAQIILCDPHRAVVIGHDHKFCLRPGRMSSPDIRAGIAMLLAAMSANGVSRIDNIEQIDRGYESIETRLNALGAKIERKD